MVGWLVNDELGSIVRKQLWPDWNTIPSFAGRDWGQYEKSQHSWCPGWDPNQLPPKYESREVALKLFWFTVHCKTYTNVLAYFVYKIKNILIYFKLWIKIKIMDVINRYTNGFPLIFKIYFHDIRSTPSHLLRRTVWESLVRSVAAMPVRWVLVVC
jgi:hypothetical protein